MSGVLHETPARHHAAAPRSAGLPARLPARFTAPLTAPLAARWRLATARERRLVTGATLFIGCALLWWLALAPALRTLREAPIQRNTLDAEQQRMLALQREAGQLLRQPRTDYDVALRALEASVQSGLGNTARLAVLGERATLTVRGASAQALAAWLAQARANAHAVPLEARLARAIPTTPAAGAAVVTSPSASATPSVPSLQPATLPPLPSTPGAAPASAPGSLSGVVSGSIPGTASAALKPNAAPDTTARWDGTVTLALPPQ